VVEQVTVNHLAGGSNPSWGASLNVAITFMRPRHV
jgi:hypothetical protein